MGLADGRLKYLSILHSIYQPINQQVSKFLTKNTLICAALRQRAIRTKTWLGPYLRVSAASVGPIGIHRAMPALGI
jgi:hypothetical protein